MHWIAHWLLSSRQRRPVKPCYRIRACNEFCIDAQLCLAVKYGDTVQGGCVDFILNISKGGCFIVTDSPLKKGSKIIMHFYIPPDRKLLGEFQGEVVAVNIDNPLYPKGMHIKFIHCSEETLKRLEEYLEEKRHLLDEVA